MPQPVNFGNVSLTLQQFNEIASGKYNAGEVRLDGERALAKINNHVHFTGLNKVSLSHAEVLAIKIAFVKALSQNGVQGCSLDRIREELGLEAKHPNDLQLSQRSLRPLSRQQIREILDSNGLIAYLPTNVLFLVSTLLILVTFIPLLFAAKERKHNA